MKLLKALTFGEMIDFLHLKENEASVLYHEKNYTSRQLAEHYNILFTTNWPKCCLKVLGLKGMGWGGARKGAGNFSEQNPIKKIQQIKKTQKEKIVIEVSKEIAEIIRTNRNSNAQFVEKAILFYQQHMENQNEDSSVIEEIDRIAERYRK